MTALLAALSLVVSLPAAASPPPPVTVVHGPSGLETLLAAPGKAPLVVHFWATWCSACRHELPRLAKLFAQARARGARVVLVSLDDPDGGAAKVTRMLDRLQVPGERYLLDAPDSAPIVALVDSSWDGALPATFVFREGKRRATFIGPLEKGPALLDALAP